MSHLEEIKIDLKGIASILKDQNSYVPKYQRSYAWQEENIRNLFLDIDNAITSGDKEYFLGSVVISQRVENQPEIVDGQQRLATTCILIAAIRDYFHNLKTDDGNERSNIIYGDYLAKKNLDSLEVLPKIHLNDSDHNYFLHKIIAPPEDKNRQKISPSRKSHERIALASKLAQKHIEAIVTTSSAPAKTLSNWISYLTNKAKVIIVKVPDESNAFTIFETLNDRGLALAVSDLLKNYLFFRSEDRITEVQQEWIQMTARIEKTEDEKCVIDYIRHLWSSQKGLVREKELFQKIKQSITTKTEAITFASELHESSKAYSAMLTCDDDYWSQYPPAAKASMQTLNFFKMVQIRPLVVTVLDRFENKEIEKVLKKMVNWAVRFLIVGGLGGGALENMYCNAAVKIRKNEIANSAQLSTFMQKITPDDTTFKDAFKVAKISKNYLARYYLRILEMENAGEQEPEFIPNDAKDIVTLEHILPQKPSTDWGNINSEEAKSNYKRLGNMALLRKTINSDIGNKGFSAKLPFYKDSDYVLTSSICELDKWDIDAIDQRQTKLSQLAIQAWPL